MAPATKRKIEDDDITEIKGNDSSNTKGKSKPSIISSTLFDRSYKLLEKKPKEDRATKPATHLDLARKHKNSSTANNSADAAASTSNTENIISVTDDEMEGDWEQPNETHKPAQDNKLDKSIELTNKYEPLST